ncbi:MAG: Autophagy protein 7 [Cirrosporium novae-zelandiae]|nr:MAG: Autophagy protein 7 [Cirrosporium novae-zelandiae]
MQFTPFASDIELPFYASLASLKINHDKLDDSARKLLGLYEIRPGDRPETSCRMQIRGNALTSDEVPMGFFRAEGMIKNVNTIEEYKNLDKAAVLQRAGRTVWDAINDGTIYSCPSLLSSFVAISFANLKKYRFSYWFAFPALHSDPTWVPVQEEGIADISEEVQENASKKLTSNETTALVESVQTWRYGVDARQHGFFLAKKIRKTLKHSEGGEGHGHAQVPTTPGSELEFSWSVTGLGSYEAGFFKDTDQEDCFVCFADPSTYAHAPGWMLRNLLVLIRQRWKLDRVRILCYRDTPSRRDDANSIILDLTSSGPVESKETPEDQSQTLPPMPKVTGWERNPAGKLAGKLADLTEYMDPQRLADQSADLNLKLMKWRIAPDLDLEKIKNTKCLLLGAGTLGSYVARNLLAWGVRKITFVDNATVSYSNPVRQPLFDFKDCLEGGAKKAYRAAEALTEIFPSVDSEGHVMSVPMAGHPITDAAKTQEEFETLKSLIESHDVIILLMDTRESRWLPTVMGKSAGKLIMNAALGFDTYVVMRHGQRFSSNRDEELGCYFCNDVVAPADSIKDQTLDQQCTVTRPGIAGIASALLVELLVSVLQHPLGGLAPAPTSQSSERSPPTHPLGLVPHQIRGFLSTFQNMVIRGRSYDCCSACSDKVIEAYEADPWEFVQKALNEPGYVEELSGLAEVQRRAEEAAKDVDWDEEEGEGVEEGDGEII